MTMPNESRHAVPQPDSEAEPLAPAEQSNGADRQRRAQGHRSPALSIAQPAGETGGPAGPEPTRYGDWEKGGRCFDF